VNTLPFAEEIASLQAQATATASMSKSLPVTDVDPDAFERLLELRRSGAFDHERDAVLEHAALHQLHTALVATFDHDSSQALATFTKLDAAGVVEWITSGARLAKTDDNRRELFDACHAGIRALFLSALPAFMTEHVRKTVEQDPGVQQIRADVALLQAQDQRARLNDRAIH
jgi:hypothetical protein